MGKTLHILNGDSTANIFAQTTIKGDIIVWREMLCEGVINNEIGSDPFWKSRYAFFEKELGISKLEYYDKTIKELVKLEDLAGYTEVVLWFEFDLYCQINFLAACTLLLKSFRKDINYYLVCTGKEKGKKHLQTLSDYSAEGYKILYENKQKITRNNMFFAEESWNLFIENNPEKLREFNFKKVSKFAYLQTAINQHLKRFPEENGLNQIENKILALIYSGLTDKNKIIKEILIWQQKETVYGFSDIQYRRYFKKLKPYYINKNDVVLINKEGEKKIKN